MDVLALGVAALPLASWHDGIAFQIVRLEKARTEKKRYFYRQAPPAVTPLLISKRYHQDHAAEER